VRRFTFFILLVLVWCISGAAAAQGDFPRPVPGDPPRAALITVEPANDAGEVSIIGAANAVFPTAQLAIRNLYTNQVVYTQAGITGTFRVRMFGPGNTPFLISPSQGTTPPALLNRPGSLPGGPATIVWGGLPALNGDGARFTISGAMGRETYWSALGQVNRVTFSEGDPQPLNIRLDFTVPRPAGAEQSSLRFIGRLELLPVAVQDGDELRAVGSVDTNNGWSGVLTPSGLAIDDVGTTIPIGEAVAESGDIAVVLNGLAFTLEFDNRLPGSLLPGLYVPVLRPLVRADDALPEAWSASALYGSAQGSSSGQIRLPLVINVGEVGTVQLPAALLMDAPSDGGRGVLPVDAESYALSNRVRFNPPSYVLPLRDAEYSLEPYLPQILNNAYDRSVAPLIPFRAETGALTIEVEAPDGTRFAPPSLPILQGQIGTAQLDESTLFGRQSPVDIYQWTTLDPTLRRYRFTQYGEHSIRLNVSFEDVFGNRYESAGEYRVVIAEPLDLTPAILPGTPFHTGDAVNLGVHVAPSAAAEVRVRLVVFPLDGSAAQETIVEGSANAAGIFQPSDALLLETPGEYIIDYEARFTDAEGQLWAGSLRSAGVIASGDGVFVARGERGLLNAGAGVRQAWYQAERVLANAGLARDGQVIFRMPYFSGDVLWLGDGQRSGIAPMVSLHDLVGTYEAWLLNGVATDASAFGRDIRERALLRELPAALLDEGADPYNPASLANPASAGYTFISLVRPNVTLRQFVSGSVQPVLPVWVDMDDPVNRQIGAGYRGMQAGDYVFMFGGAVVRQPELGIASSAAYASVAFVTAADAAPGARVAPPSRGADGTADAGALLVLPNASYDAFFVPTGVQPGDVLSLGDVVTMTGQTAPALPVTVAVTITAPSGSQRQTYGRASAVGYYYDPGQDFVVDEPGIWTVEVAVLVDSQTSAGQPLPPFSGGGIPGAPDGRFSFYVVDDASLLLTRSSRADISIPSALPYNFSFTLPQGWSADAAAYTLRADGYILEQGSLRLSGRTFTYQYNSTNINRRFPNMEVEAREDGAAVSDAKQLVFFVQARDANGAPRLLYRIYHIFHDRLISLAEGGDGG
jgi:hypothetical protein